MIVRLQLASCSPESKEKKNRRPLVLNLESVSCLSKVNSNLDPGKLPKEGLSLPCKNENILGSTGADGLQTAEAKI